MWNANSLVQDFLTRVAVSIANNGNNYTTNASVLYQYFKSILSVALISTVFANGPWDRGSIPHRVIPKTQKWYLMPLCLILSIIRYRSKVKWCNPENGVALSHTPWCGSYWKGSPGSTSTKIANFTLIFISIFYIYFIFIFYIYFISTFHIYFISLSYINIFLKISWCL